MKGTLEQYLAELDRDAWETFDLLTRQYIEVADVTEEFKTAETLNGFVE